MNKRLMALGSRPGPVPGTDYFALIICGALFLCGCVAGTTAAGLADSPGLSDYLADYLAAADSGISAVPDYLAVLLSTCKYHLAAVFFGFSVLGVLFLPVMSAVRGFFLCFSISAIVRHFGGNGVLLALTISGISALFTIPCFFILSVQSFAASLSLLRCVTVRDVRGAFPVYGVSFFRRILVCLAVLACSVLLDTLLFQKLVSYFAAHLP